jgi:hypothetical protein
MSKLARQFSKPAFHLLLFCVCVALISWPFLTIADRTNLPWAMIAYLFCVWAFMILLLFLVGRSVRRQIGMEEPRDRQTPGNSAC